MRAALSAWAVLTITSYRLAFAHVALTVHFPLGRFQGPPSAQEVPAPGHHVVSVWPGWAGVNPSQGGLAGAGRCLPSAPDDLGLNAGLACDLDQVSYPPGSPSAAVVTGE